MPSDRELADLLRLAGDLKNRAARKCYNRLERKLLVAVADLHADNERLRSKVERLVEAARAVCHGCAYADRGGDCTCKDVCSCQPVRAAIDALGVE
jgi:hypothetical protein